MESKALVAKTLELIKKYGAQDARAVVSRQTSTDITWRKSKIENMSSSGSSALGIDIYVDGRFGTHSTSDLREDAVDAFVKRAIDVTRLLEPDEFRALPDPKYYEGRTTEDLQSYDEAVEKMTASDLVEEARRIEEAALAHSEAPIQDVTTGASAETYDVFSATTNGFEGERRGTYVANQAEVVLKAPDGKVPSDYAFAYTRYRNDLEASQAIADLAVKRSMRLLGQKKLPTKNRTVLFDNVAASSFMSHFLGPISGAAIDQKQSYFLDKIGQKCGSSLLNLIDMPHIPRGLNSRAFDGEGMATKTRPIFENGELKMYTLTNYYARKLKMEPTLGSFTNVVFGGAQNGQSLEDLIKGISDGIFVTSLLGGNKDAVRGDFSYGIVGMAIENGELTTPISEMNINGNFTTFWNNLSAIGNNVNLYSTLMMPSLRIDDVSLSGS